MPYSSADKRRRYAELSLGLRMQSSVTSLPSNCSPSPIISGRTSVKEGTL